MDRFKRSINLVDKDVAVMNFNGGEPTLLPKLFDVFRYTREKLPNAVIQLQTNARMFSYNSYTKDFIGLGLNNFNFLITLYGHNAAVHDAITRSPGAFEQTVKGIKNLLSYGQSVEVRVVVNKINYKYVEDIAKFALENFPGIYRLAFLNLKVTGECYKNRKHTVVPYTEVIPYITKAVEVLKGKLNVNLFHFPLCILPKEYWDFCIGPTINDMELAHPQICETCTKKDKCAKIWKSYADVKGTNEFKSI